MGKFAQFEIAKNNFGKIKGDVLRGIRRWQEEAGEHIEGEAKKAIEADPIRVDTGLLRNSITYAVGGQPTHIKTYSADKPRTEGGETESGSYSGNAPDSGKDTRYEVYIGSNVEYAV